MSQSKTVMYCIYLLADTHAAGDINTEYDAGFINATTTCSRCCRRWLHHIRHVRKLWDLIRQNVDSVSLITELTLPYLHQTHAT